MGTARPRPQRLPAKLLQIREAFGATQEELVRLLGAEGDITRSYVSLFESGQREPPMPIVLKYARLAGVSMDVLVDDDLDLPGRIPANPPYHPSVARDRGRRRS